MALQAAQVTVTTAPVAIVSHPGGPNPITVRVNNTGANCYIGATAQVSAANGYQLNNSQSQTLTIYDGETLWGYCATTTVVSYLASGF
jgi:hypothetical protein